jgi:hypothetical protein
MSGGLSTFILSDVEALASAVLNDDAVGGVDDTPQVRNFMFLPPWPNPSGDASTNLEFALPRQEHVRRIVYDVAGREVARLKHADYPVGRHRAVWNGKEDNRTKSAQVYFVRFSPGGKNIVTRMVLIR